MKSSWRINWQFNSSEMLNIAEAVGRFSDADKERSPG
jgi:hypothetical protein